MIPPITFVIKSVIYDDLKPLIKGYNVSILKLNKNVYNTVFNNFGFLFLISGNKNPNGIVMIMFKIICLIKSPLPYTTSIKGTKFIGVYG